MNSQFQTDVLNCLANLSSDEVFTSPELVNKMLDELPQKLFASKETKFLDPCCKSGVFLREIAKRLIVGLENQIPDLQERVNHIMKNQLYGISLTHLTALLSRRSLYCAKNADSKYSVTNFGNSKNAFKGNIEFLNINHTWEKDRCIYCGVTKSEYDRGKSFESYAYAFIHDKKLLEEMIKMKFDVIIGNPPYQLKVAKQEEQQNAISIYNLFIENAIKLKPKYLSMIIPSRWMSGGRGLDNFRSNMLNDEHISVIHDFIDARECFPNVEIKGGVCYFLRDFSHKGLVDYYLHSNGEVKFSRRKLNECGDDCFVRDWKALSIISKVENSSDFKSFSLIAGSQTPFGIVSSFKDWTEKPNEKNTLKIYGNHFEGYTNKKYILKKHELVDTWKVLAPKAVGTGIIQTDKIKPFVPIKPSICTQTYIIYGDFKTKNEAENLCSYMETKFFHFLLGQLKHTQQMSPQLFRFVPIQDWHESWSDEKLYKKYKLTTDEINYIEQTIWPTNEVEDEE